MSGEKQCTTLETIEAAKYTKQYGRPIKNDFTDMMRSALPGAIKVLKKRQDDLKKWGDTEQRDFLKIMGVSGNIYIDHTFYRCDVYDEKTYSPPEVEKTTVVEFMRKAVDRILYIMEQLHVDNNPVEVSITDPCAKEISPVPDKKVRKYGNFVNRTYTSQYSAFVERDATWKCSPDQYKDKLEVNIGFNFCRKPLMGPDSKASTLCHEVSHFHRVENKYATEEDKAKSRGPWGGVGTDDLPNDADHKDEKGPNNTYIKYRKELKDNHSLKVFENAYNFELYFELTDKECKIVDN